MRLLKSKKRPKREKEIAAEFKEAAYEKYGCFDLHNRKGLLQIVKLTTLGMYGEKGWEDHLILIHPGANLHWKGPRTVFIEWKRPGTGVVSDLQEKRIAEHKLMGFDVAVCDTVEEGMSFLKEVIGR